MTVRELREKYLAFFLSKGHQLYPAASLIPYDATGRLDESLMFTGAGMVQFKPFFRGVARPDHPRLVTCQRCVRTGDIDEVGDPTHLTFFEMLGNFSIGDYFKAQAVAYSWEFMTSPEWLGLDPKRLSFTVFEEDNDAYAEWESWLIPAGIDPSTRIFRLGEDTNYWPAGSFSKGPPGPCGPNSEMFYWVADEPPPTGPYTREDFLRDEHKWLEIWNDVFIQYEWEGHLRNPERASDGYEKDGMPPLPFQSVDTGMGLERTAVAIGGQKSIYDTDIFEPILKRIVALANRSNPSYATYGSDETLDRAVRIIADHIRTSVFCIMDGVLPSNTGRGYVLRRLIRRAVLKGQRTLGFTDPFFHLVYEGVVEALGDFYPELTERRDVIVETLRNEEALFRRTLSRGIEELDKEFEQILVNISRDLAQALIQDRSFELPLSPELRGWREAEALNDQGELDDDYFSGWLERFDWSKTTSVLKEASEICEMLSPPGPKPVLPGGDAFRLYDTFGFPLEVTQEIASEAGVWIDIDGYEQALKEAQERSRAGQERESVYGGVSGSNELATEDAPETTHFTGYGCTEEAARIVRVRIPNAERQTPNALQIALDRTPFYAESGGQTGDHGHLILEDGTTLEVTNTTKSAGTFWHQVSPHSPPSPQSLLGRQVTARVIGSRRARIQRNHTATHLLHAALRSTLGTHVTQAGSYVGPDNLRFDFTHGKAMTPEEIAKVERIVNEQVLESTPVQTHVDIPISEAKARGAMALFGEKYGNKVRMVEVGDFSKELCGGTHVRTTGEIGLFKIISEASAASGVRRIEAITGEAAYEWALEQANTLKEAANAIKSTPKDLVQSLEKLQEQLKEERRRREKAEVSSLKGGTKAEGEQNVELAAGVKLWVRNFGEVDQKIAAQALDNAAAQDPNFVGIVAVVSDGRITFLSKSGKEAVTKGAHSGNLVKEVAKIAGGGGGGKPDFATAGGKDASKVDEALATAPAVLGAMLGVSAD
ncbi:MAG: alanine--tRNA ligase [Fimbriimonas sp.]